MERNEGKLTLMDKMMRICIALLILVMLLSSSRFVGKKILIDRIHMDAYFLHYVFPEAFFMDVNEKEIKIKWEEKYPFDNTANARKKDDNIGECKIVCVKRNCTNLLYAPYWGNQS